MKFVVLLAILFASASASNTGSKLASLLEQATEVETETEMELTWGRRRRRWTHIPHGHDPHGHIPHGHDPHAHIPHGHDPHAHVPVDAAVQAVVDAAEDVGDFVAEGAQAVGDFAVDASGNVINLVEDWANEAVDALKTALDYLIAIGTCLISGPVECIFELIPSKYQNVMDNIMNSIMDICETFVDIFEAIFNLVAAVIDGVQCDTYTGFPYPEVSISSVGIPSVSMKTFDICSGVTYDMSGVTDAVNAIGNAVTNSTLYATLIDDSGLGSSGLIEHKTAEGRLKLGHELNEESCDPSVGAFELGFGGEGQYKIGAMGVGISILIGCHADGHVSSDIRIHLNFGLATPTSEPGSASVGIGWGNSYPAGFDDEFTWSVGAGDYQIGVGTSGISDWLSLSNFEFKGVGVDIAAEKFAELSSTAATKLTTAASNVGTAVVNCISGLAAGLVEQEADTQLRSIASAKDATTVVAKVVEEAETDATSGAKSANDAARSGLTTEVKKKLKAREEEAKFPGNSGAAIGFHFSFCYLSFTEADCNY